MPEIIEAALQADLRDGQLRRAQERSRMADAEVIDVGDRCFAECFFEETAEILLIHSGQRCQLSKSKGMLVVLADVADYGLQKLHARVVHRLVRGEQSMLRENSENVKKRRLDLQLRNGTFDGKLIQLVSVFPEKDRADPEEFLLDFRKSRVLRPKESRKRKLMLCQWKQKLFLRRVRSSEGEQVRREDNRLFTVPVRIGGQCMQLSAVDKAEAGADKMSQRHIDFHLIRVLLKINNLDGLVPVVLDRKWKARRIAGTHRLVKCTWKAEAPMLPCFL